MRLCLGKCCVALLAVNVLVEPFAHCFPFPPTNQLSEVLANLAIFKALASFAMKLAGVGQKPAKPIETVPFSEAIVCLPDECDQVRCKKVSEESCEAQGGKFTAKGGFCGCCDSCPKKLTEGDDCGLSFIRGTPPPVACDDGLRCDFETKECVSA